MQMTTEVRRAEEQPTSQATTKTESKLVHAQDQTQVRDSKTSLDQAKEKFGKNFKGRVAFCPMEGEVVDITVNTSQVVFNNGQRIFFCCDNCKTNFREHPHMFLKHPGDPMFADLPQVEGMRYMCPDCGHEDAVADDTPTVCFKNGQKLFFHDYGCVAKFVKNPLSWEAPMGAGQKIASALRIKDDKGPFFSATCPVTGHAIALDTRSPHVEFKGGQKVFTCCPKCPMEIYNKYNEYLWHAERDAFLHPPKPDACGLLLECPVTGDIVRVTDKTPRVLFKNGQALYFKSIQACEEFLAAPQKFSLSATVPAEQREPMKEQQQREALQASLPTSSRDTTSVQGKSAWRSVA